MTPDLHQLPNAMRPREKLLARGPAALADVELLAVLLRTGTRGQSVLALAEHLLQRFGGLSPLLHANATLLSTAKGLGQAKRAELMAVLELARRAMQSQLNQRSVFDSPQAVKDYAALHLRELPHECFAVMFLDAQHRLLTMETLFRGTLTQTAVHPREVVQSALQHRAAAVILAHNHPSGLAEPSRADEHLTDTLKRALALIDVRVLDHLVVAREAVVSMAERGCC